MAKQPLELEEADFSNDPLHVLLDREEEDGENDAYEGTVLGTQLQIVTRDAIARCGKTDELRTRHGDMKPSKCVTTKFKQ